MSSSIQHKKSSEVNVHTRRERSKDGHVFDLYCVEPVCSRGVAAIVLGEIYGLNNYVKEVCERYANAGVAAFAPNLYARLGQNVVFSYSQEVEAHAASVQKLKVEEAILDIAQSVESAHKYRRVCIVGFSYGATLGWIASSRIQNLNYFCGYYGNRIALNLELHPVCNFDLIFGLRDTGLSNERLALIKERIPACNLHLLNIGHGFDCHDRLDKYSPEFSMKCFEMCLSRMLEN